MSQITKAISNSGPGGYIQTLTSNVGGPVPPTAGNINVVGGTGITGTGNPGTSTITLDLSADVATQYDADIGSAVPAANILNITGGPNILTSGAGSTITIDLNGTTDHAIQIGNALGSLTSLGVAANGQLPIGSAGADPVLATLTPSTGISITNGPGSITIAASGSVATTYTEDVGAATPAANNLNILGAHGINTSGAASTVTVAVNNTLALGDLAVVAGDSLTLTTGNATITAGNLNLPNTNGAGTQGEITFGAARFISNFGATNTFVGSGSGNTTLTGFSNAGFGTSALSALTSGAFNTAVGFNSQLAMTAGTNNISMGEGSLAASTGAGTNNNTALGSLAISTATAPVNNIAVGYNAASAYTTNESNNIIIGNVGTIADSATIRIGTNPTHTATFVAGIDGVNVGSTAKVVTMGTGATADKLGTATITAGAGITVTPGANTITISGTGADILAYTNVNTTPYVVLSTDEFLGVDCSGAPIQINLPNAPTAGRVYYIKDRTGNANINNITVTTVGGVVLIDAAATYTMNTQYAAISVLFDGATYQIF